MYIFVPGDNISEFQIRCESTKIKQKVVKIVEINRDKNVSGLRLSLF